MHLVVDMLTVVQAQEKQSWERNSRKAGPRNAAAASQVAFGGGVSGKQISSYLTIFPKDLQYGRWISSYIVSSTRQREASNTNLCENLWERTNLYLLVGIDRRLCFWQISQAWRRKWLCAKCGK